VFDQAVEPQAATEPQAVVVIRSVFDQAGAADRRGDRQAVDQAGAEPQHVEPLGVMMLDQAVDQAATEPQATEPLGGVFDQAVEPQAATEPQAVVVIRSMLDQAVAADRRGDRQHVDQAGAEPQHVEPLGVMMLDQAVDQAATEPQAVMVIGSTSSR
jgi:hypothetical protein